MNQKKRNAPRSGHHRLTAGLTGGVPEMALRRTTGLVLLFAMLFSGISSAGSDPLCGLSVHAHDDSCYESRLICDEEERPASSWTEKVLSCHFSAHRHSASCYNEKKQLVCGYSDGYYHRHDDSCYQVKAGEKVLVCTLDQTSPWHNGSPYTHDDSCYETQTTLVCDKKESAGHQHSDACYTEKLLCHLKESAGHQHSDACYVDELACGREESAGHQHSDDCYVLENTCGKKESAGHQHSDDCYVAGKHLRQKGIRGPSAFRLLLYRYNYLRPEGRRRRPFPFR